MSYSDLTPENRITVFNQSIHNAISTPELSTRLNVRGYPMEKLQIGKGYGETAQEMYTLQVREYGEAYSASELYSNDSHSLREDIKDFRTISRIVFKGDKQAIQDLKLNKDLSRGFDAFRTQVDAMITNACEIPTMIEKLTPYGYDEPTLLGFSSRLATLPETRQLRDREKHEAQQATRERDQAIKIMDSWFVDLLTIAPIAVKDKPELMELLNVVVPS